MTWRSLKWREKGVNVRRRLASVARRALKVSRTFWSSLSHESLVRYKFSGVQGVCVTARRANLTTPFPSFLYMTDLQTGRSQMVQCRSVVSTADLPSSGPETCAIAMVIAASALLLCKAITALACARRLSIDRTSALTVMNGILKYFRLSRQRKLPK